MTIKCTCGTTNRIPRELSARVRCGKCQHVFTPQELARNAKHEAPPAFELDRQPDIDEEEEFEGEDDY